MMANATASASASSVTLDFTGEVPEGDFAVTVNGVATPIQSVERDNYSVTLLLPDGVMPIGDAVRVTWNGGAMQIAAE